MLEPPDVPLDVIGETINVRFGIAVESIEFLPIGADIDSALFRAISPDGSRTFVKLRRGDLASLSVEVPAALAELGIDGVIRPIAGPDGTLQTPVDGFTLSLAPYIGGQNGFERRLSARQWFDLGRSLRQLHTSRLPDELARRLPVEHYSDRWRTEVRVLLESEKSAPAPGDVASAMEAIIQENRATLEQLVDHATRLAVELQSESPAVVPCHADIHAGNVLTDDAGKLWIVDWDTFMLAPKERDLMFIGAGIGDSWREEKAAQLFYQGYGPSDVSRKIIAYYRCERIIEDIAVYAREILGSAIGGEDRERSLRSVANNFSPGGTIEIAFDSVSRASDS